MMKTKAPCIKEVRDDYNRIYSTSGLRTNSAYYRWIMRVLNPSPKSCFLDVSCGEGVLLREVNALNRGIAAFGLDIADNAAAIALKNAPSSRVVVADGQRIPFKSDFFDYVSCLGSIEHYLEPESGIRELYRVAKKNATVCIILPNSLSIDLFLDVARTGARPVDDFQIIERTATRQEWQELLMKAGFSIERVYGSNLWPELFREGSFKIKSLSKYVKRLAIKTFCPVNLAREIVFIGKKGRVC